MSDKEKKSGFDVMEIKKGEDYYHNPVSKQMLFSRASGRTSFSLMRIGAEEIVVVSDEKRPTETGFWLYDGASKTAKKVHLGKELSDEIKNRWKKAFTGANKVVNG